MKKLTIALLLSPFLAAGHALAHEASDPDLVSPRERVLQMRPDLWPDWTWMREDQAVAILKSHGYDVVLPLEKGGAAWRGKATRNNEFHHVAVNRYAHVFGHLDKESRSRRELLATGPSTATPSDGKLATFGYEVAHETSDPDLLSPRERKLHMRPDLWPDWTWMREDQAVAILKSHGYDIALPLEKASAAWRGKATRNNESYYVAVNRYAYVFGHLDKESRSRRELLATGPSTATPSDGKLATLNGPVERPVTQMAPTGLTPGRPYRTVMGETGWTWMKEGQAINLLMSKGYDRVHGLIKDDHGIWRGKALKNQVAVLVGIDVYGNTIDEPVGDGGVAQAGF